MTWATLGPENVPTCTMTPDAARDIAPKEKVALLLTPARHLLEAAHGSAELSLARAASQLLWTSVTSDTRSKYAGHIIAYLVWCEDLGLPIPFRFPIAPNILLMYLRKDMTTLRASTLEQRTYALAFWHRTQRMPWAFDRAETRAFKKAAKIECLPPLDKRRPVRLNDIVAISDPVGGPASVILALPTEKVRGTAGFDRIAPEQRHMPSLCPVAAVHRHQALNAPRQGEDASTIGAFSYIGTSGSRQELTDSFLVRTVNEWLAAAQREPITGHCFRIGGATLFFTAGRQLDEIRTRGGWQSEAYLLYLRDIYARQASTFGDLDPTDLFYG
ncbi:unnamed protein product [Tilletia laevis]|nr:unnamed protein product [Tilletia laevis]